MKCHKAVCLCSVLLAGAALLQAAGPCVSQDVSASVVINQPAGSVLKDDGLGPYVNGQMGVQNTVIHHCSGDATMALTNSQRYLGFNFPQPIPGTASSTTPPWVGTSFFTQPFFNVNEILWGRNHGIYAPYAFTTRMQFQYIMGPGNQNQRFYYSLRFSPTVADTPLAYSAPSDVNSPYQTSYVTVQDHVGGCHTDPSSTDMDSWVVTAMNQSSNSPYMQVGTLYNNQGTGVYSGQYELPYQFTITALKCLP